ncbi:uncharacterized protein LOC133201732 [Saccostrea echinata]|uniref:uncharacterized protein LOC133201732 n=1 Tax=Saccostrea echinata TaxID=191078 RepID=UPI002A825EE1|nr:uncharacterized protein LOC133201732 [Saccostrea echinata]
MAYGRHFGLGNVYLMKAKGNKFKVGSSRKPKQRLKQIKRKKPSTTLQRSFSAWEMNGAESAAQKALLKKGFKKVKRGPTEWFRKKPSTSWVNTEKIVQNSVYRHNSKQKRILEVACLMYFLQ